MRKIIIALLFSIISICANAQMTITTEGYSLYEWSDTKSTFMYKGRLSDYSTMFEFNESLTMVKHTTESMTSTYYIKYKEYDEEKGMMIYKVVSDVGNEYVFMITNQTFNIVNQNAEPVYAISYDIKQTFRK